MVKDLLRRCYPDSVHQLYADTKYWLRFKFHPQGLASEMFRGMLGYEMNWKNPQDINEKINWMKFNFDTSEWSRLADKYLVREYVKERIGEDVLVKLFGVWERAEDIDFEQLPERFVLKTNHGAGTILPVLDKSKMDVNKTRKQLNDWLSLRFGYNTVEPHYLKIPPLVIAEEYLENVDDFSKSLVDYKVFCFSGKPYCVLVCYDRVLGSHTNLSFYDCDWRFIPNILSGRHKGEGLKIPKPNCLPQLLDYSAKLAKGHPQVRVDFYIVNNKIYFGEMTFTSQGGYMDYISREYSLKMGSLINIPNLK